MMHSMRPAHARSFRGLGVGVALIFSMMLVQGSALGSAARPSESRKSESRAAKRTARRSPPSMTARAAARHATARPLAPGAAGIRVAIDPETGQTVPPTAEQMRAPTGLAPEGQNSSLRGLTEVRLPDGTRLIHLNGRFMQYSVARLDSTGRLVHGCVSDPRAVKEFVNGNGAPATQKAGE